MNKTLKEIADDLNIDKQKVYRYVKKNHITESAQVMQTKLYDDTAQSLIKAHFETRDTASPKRCERYSEDAVVMQLIKELDAKNEQITKLQDANELLLQTNQELMAAIARSQTLHHEALENKSRRKSWIFDKIKKQS